MLLRSVVYQFMSRLLVLWMLVFGLPIFFVGACADTNTDLLAEKYIETYKELAITEMARARIPASIKLAQGLIESGFGTSELAKKANNHFGIKCHSGWNGPAYYQTDNAPNECFRKYGNPSQSYADHSDFLRTRERYQSLFALDITDYIGWAKGLKAAGYATSATYAEQLINIIEVHRLYRFDIATDAEQANNNGNSKKGKTKTKPSKTNTNGSKFPDPFTYNGLTTVILPFDATQQEVATAYRFPVNLLARYNYFDNRTIPAGTKIYFESKRNKAKRGLKYHLVKSSDETLFDISQQYGVKVNKLAQRNGITTATPLTAGEQIYLRKCRPKGNEITDTKQTPGKKTKVKAKTKIKTI